MIADSAKKAASRGNALEDLRRTKHSQTLQVFSGLLILLLLPFGAPTSAQLGIVVHSLVVGLGFVKSTYKDSDAHGSPLDSIQVQKNPFVAFLTLDGIGIREKQEILHSHK